MGTLLYVVLNTIFFYFFQCLGGTLLVEGYLLVRGYLNEENRVFESNTYLQYGTFQNINTGQYFGEDSIFYSTWKLG